jgi:hypothetical protein
MVLATQARWQVTSQFSLAARQWHTFEYFFNCATPPRQGGTGLNTFVAVRSTSPVADAVFGTSDGFKRQPILDSYPRDFRWQGYKMLDLADLYPGTSHDMVREVAKWQLLDDGRGGISWEEYRLQALEGGQKSFGWKVKTFNGSGIERHGP